MTTSPNAAATLAALAAQPVPLRAADDAVRRFTADPHAWQAPATVAPRPVRALLPHLPHAGHAFPAHIVRAARAAARAVPVRLAAPSRRRALASLRSARQCERDPRSVFDGAFAGCADGYPAAARTHARAIVHAYTV